MKVHEQQNMHATHFEKHGFMQTPPLLKHAAWATLEGNVSWLPVNGIGARDLLDYSWCIALARSLREHAIIKKILPPDAVCVQCTYFEKSKAQNWLVPIHQDLSIPVKAKIDHPELTGWSEKDGSIFVQPPVHVLHAMVAVRLHVDDCGPDDGPLRVVPGSHKNGRVAIHEALAEREGAGEFACCSAKGGALLMRPLLLHASSKAAGHNRRRVLHFVYGPRELPYGLNWKYAV